MKWNENRNEKEKENKIEFTVFNSDIWLHKITRYMIKLIHKRVGADDEDKIKTLLYKIEYL